MPGFVNGEDLALRRIGNPDSHTLSNLTAKWGDIARSLDLILGGRWDAAGNLGTDIATIIAGMGGGGTISGTADGGSAGTLVDAALTQGDDYFNGQVCAMNTGNNTGLARVIVDFIAATDTLYFEPDFPSAIGAGDEFSILAKGQFADILIGNNNNDNVADTSLVVANANGSVLEREEYLQTSVGADLTGQATTIDTVVDGIQTDLNNAVDGLGALKTLIDGVDTKVGTAITDIGTVDTVVDGIQTDLNNAVDGLGALKTLIDNVKTVVDNVENYVDGTTATPQAYRRETGVRQIIEFSVTCAANAAQTTISTVGTQAIMVESIVVYADAAQTGDLTELDIKGGDSGSEVTFISRLAQADLHALSEQGAWTGAVRLAVGDLITIDPIGTGATALDLTVTVAFFAIVDGGVLS